MKQHTVLIGILLLAGFLSAQTDNFPAVIVASQGNVQYTSADNSVKKLKVAPGSVVKKDGTLTLARNSSAVVYCNGRLQRIQEKGTHPLPDVFKPGGMASLNFDRDFGRYIQASVEFVASKQVGDGWGTTVTNPKQSGDGWGTTVTNPKQSGDGWGSAVTNPKQSGDGWGTTVTNPKQSGDGWGASVTNPKQSGDGWGNAVTNPKQSGDGWGGTGARMVPILPFGNLTPGNTRFAWSRPAGANTYQLDILDDDEKMVHSITTKDTFVSIDLRTLNLETNRMYAWKVHVPGNTELSTLPLSFALSTTEAQTAATNRASNSPTYRDGGPVERGMMEAVALERAEWFEAAEQRYAALLKQHPKNNMLRVMYAAFWMRYGLEPKAKEVLRG